MDDTLGAGLLFASLFKKKKENYVMVANNLYAAEKIYNFLLNFLDEEDLVFFPSDELLRAENLSSGRELLAQRLYALGRLQEEKRKKILVVHPASLLRFLPSPERFKSDTLFLKKGEEHSLPQLKLKLVEMGYQGVNKVDHSLQFASRGDILDIYSVSYQDPIRIEFFGDEIDSIRTFDVATQHSKEEMEEMVALPASDLLLSDEDLSSFVERAKLQVEADKKRLGKEAAETLEQNVALDIEDFVSKNYRPALYKYYGYALNEFHSVLEYFNPKMVYVCSKKSFTTNVDMLRAEARQYFDDLVAKGRLMSHLEEYMPLEKAIPNRKIVLASEAFASDSDTFRFAARPIVMTGRSLAHIVPTIQTYLSDNGKVVLALKERQQRETVINLLNEANIPFEAVDGFDLPKGNLGITRSYLNEGFDIQAMKIAYLSASEVFGHKTTSSRFTARFKDATILRSYEDLHPGDYVVHEFKGIGQFVGIQTIETKGIHRDYLHIAYAGGEKLYVPLEQFRLVRKYAGREGAAPKLSHLSGTEWEKRKARIKKRVNELADRLIALYGDRAKVTGFAFPQDDDLQRQFESEFPHQLTADQERSLNEIKEDMEKPEAMDRLLCGDVGFGKTEIAFRAAFKAINGGKQVAMLAPTTLLARQHYELALERFRSFGVHIAQMSRLIPAAEQKRYIEQIKEGKIDLVIGTHRLLSKEIVFKDLGLLIVDEEQRFGVEQKERIKEIKKNVDVLSLSATPIPRTLQMSLVGIRPLSQINTPPASRMPIQTYVTPFQFSLVRELVEREISRHGQVFYIHNKIDTIYSIASKIEANCLGAKCGVVHGQMDKEMVEEVMERFYDGELNVLVATSIVENGIDVPNANMLIVEDADRFGLSQLYQIKGRVGRGDRIAYAYLMYKEHKEMNEDAQKRLQAIQEFTDLGSGYKIAQRDLMIRGAGDILGPEQAGFIDSIGLDLYLKMLNEAVSAKKEGKEIEPPKPNRLLNIDAYIPKEYAINSDKIQLYQQLDEIHDEEALKAFVKSIRDIYGKMPKETALLVQKKRIDLLSEKEEFSSVTEEGDFIDIVLSDRFTKIDGMGSDLFNQLLPFLSILKVTFIEKRLKIRMKKRENWMDDLEKVMTVTDKLYRKRVGNL